MKYKLEVMFESEKIINKGTYEDNKTIVGTIAIMFGLKEMTCSSLKLLQVNG